MYLGSEAPLADASPCEAGPLADIVPQAPATLTTGTRDGSGEPPRAQNQISTVKKPIFGPLKKGASVSGARG